MEQQVKNRQLQQEQPEEAEDIQHGPFPIEQLLQTHSKDTNMRYAECSDYEDLEIVIGNDVAVGKNSIGLSSIGTDARTLTLDDDKGYRDARIESSPLDSTRVESTPLVHEVSTQRKKTQYKRSRTRFEGNSSSNGAIKEVIDKLSNTFDEVHSLFKKSYAILEKREKERAFTAWDAIKEIPNLDEESRLKALELINTTIKKDSFLKMTIEERARWIAFKIKN